MAEINFIYEGNDIIIQCGENEVIKDIIERFLAKIGLSKNNNLVYLYNGALLNEKLTFKEQLNKFDDKRMNVIVNKNDSTYIQNIISKDIICPICNETIFMDIKDYKINLYGCKNNHKNENILLNKFEDSQKIILNDIKCNLCGRNRGNIYNNEFFICITCDKTICPLCRLNHTKEHIIMNYDDKNYICKNHNKSYYKYCNTCKEDMCKSCKNKHRNHDILKFKDKLVKKNDLKKSNKDLKNVLDTFKYKSNIIKEILEKMNNMMDIYYKINNNIINNYNINKMNYYTLLNINKIKNNNEKLIKELNDVINDDKILEYSLNNFYNENGDKYFGDLNNGLKEGKGIYYYKNDERKCYDGDWKNDNRDGKGILYFNDGDKYVGDWKNDKKEGKGIYYWKNGDKYDGDWKDNKKEGKGKMHYNNGSSYEGDWKNDKQEGKGKYY